jgi:hypothetical protein
MGLFDSYLNSAAGVSPFNPASYGVSARGLLGHLPMWSYQAPVFPTAAQDATDSSGLANAAVPSTPVPNATALAGTGPQPGTMMDRIGQGLNDNAATLMALGGGIAQGGLGRGLQLAAQAGVQEAQLGQKKATAQSIAQSLIWAGTPPAIALTIAQSQNPQLVRYALERYGR